MEKTYVIKGKPEPGWVLVDAMDENLGRLATRIAAYLLGKNKPTFTPGVMMGDCVVVVNAAKLRLSNKRMDTKSYFRISGYPGGITQITLRDQMRVHPERVIKSAVWGMLPHNKVGRRLIKRLYIYAGSEHPHAAQQPQPEA